MIQQIGRFEDITNSVKFIREYYRYKSEDVEEQLQGSGF
jgi:hypothetical protein